MGVEDLDASISTITSGPRQRSNSHGFVAIGSNEPSHNVVHSPKLQSQIDLIRRNIGTSSTLRRSINLVPFASSQLFIPNSKKTTSKKSIPILSRKSNTITKSILDDDTDDVDLYTLRLQFKKLAIQNDGITVPTTSDPVKLKAMYKSALAYHKETRTSPTWLLYSGIAYTGMYLAMNKVFQMDIPPEFITVQISTISHYKELLTSLGDPGGLSIGSSWPPWLKFLAVALAHSLIFVVVYKMTGSASMASMPSDAMCALNIGGKTDVGMVNMKPDGLANAFGALGNGLAGKKSGGGIGNLLGGLLGGGGSGGGLDLNGIIGGLLGGMGNTEKDDIDIDNPPDPVDQESDLADKPSMFD